MIVARRFVLSGRVQGVGFRWFTLQRAQAEGIGGEVRNLPGGDVEVTAEGEAEAMERFERAIRTGPPHARVDAVETEILAPTGRRSGFTAR